MGTEAVMKGNRKTENAKLLFGLGFAVVVLPMVWYLLSPLFRVVELNEQSPLAQPPGPPHTPELFQNGQKVYAPVKDKLATMSEAMLSTFIKETEAMETVVMEKNETMPQAPRVLKQAPFELRAHGVQGRAILVDTPAGTVLRFEDFLTINGPDLRVYLGSELGDDDIVDLGSIRATKGNVNYAVPEGINLQKYNKVLIWCRAFSVLFSFADLE
jgi:hypothetical protein